MSIPGLPSPDVLASMVSNVTETMCGITFEPADTSPAPAAACHRLARLPIKGERPITVALSSDEKSCAQLGSALFSCPPESLDSSMINDSLCELLNMAAGQIKSALSLDQSLGLPRIVEGPELAKQSERARQEGTLLRSRGSLNLLLWIADEAD